MSQPVTAVLFTHPMCVGCGEAIALLTRLGQQNPRVQVRFLSLAGKEGKAAGERLGVHAVPTVVFQDNPALRMEGVPEWEALTDMVERLAGEAIGTETSET
ncbi:MAG: hypothetical protein OEV94_07725 [Deltaproteobacteria bacterium]|nr:hypothetical protein [Deltaproteobacteria bacterium]